MALIQIDRDSLFHNLEWFSKKVGSKERVAIVLKDNAYGHGLKIIAELSREFGIEVGVVRELREALDVKDEFKEVIVLGDRAVNIDNFSFVLNSIDDIERAERGSRVELKVDTGMSRNGITADEINLSLDLIEDRGLNLVGVLSHNRSADELSSELFWQNMRFSEVKRVVMDRGFRDIRFHSFNSSTTIRLNSKNEDLVRVGIGAYGYSEINPIFNPPELKPVLSLYADRVSSRYLKSGSRVGYGGEFSTNRDMEISTYDIGYGDGLFRGDDKNPIAVDSGLPILGRVSMDYISLESGEDRVCIFRDVKPISSHLNTISYEVLSRLSPSIRRVIT